MNVIHGKRGYNREKLSLKGRKSNWATTHTHARLKTSGELGLQLKTSFLFRIGHRPEWSSISMHVIQNGLQPEKNLVRNLEDLAGLQLVHKQD